jgi:phage recombination protein Bet
MTTPIQPSKQLVKTTDKEMEYVPFAAQDKIKLTIAIVQNLIAVKTKSGKTCSESDAIKFMMMCQARKLNPFEGDAFLIGYDSKDGPTFSLITAHQAFLKRAEVNPEYDGMKSGVIIRRDGEVKDLEGDFYLEGDELLGGWSTIFFKTRKQPMHKRIRLKRFQKAWGIWQDDPAGMICKCAEADGLRSSFPTLLGGLYLREEVAAIDVSSKVSSPLFTAPTPAAIESGPSSHAGEIPSVSDEAAAKVSPVKQVRELCVKAKLAEPMLLDFLRDTGSIGADVNTLEGAALENADALPMVIGQFDEIVKRINEMGT